MLTYIHIRNLAIATDLNLECERGMSAITGETGAGKSILIDALSLALGERADSSLVSPGSPRAEITLHFDLKKLPQIAAWLNEHELSEGEECLIRRTIGADGRSRAFINDQTVTVSQLRELGSFLIDIHGQHAYHSLLNPDMHLSLLDNYAGLQSLCHVVREAYKEWQQIDQQLRQLQRSAQERESRLELLQFQLEEFADLELTADTWEKLTLEHKQLANAEQLLQQAHAVLDCLSGNQQGNALFLLQQAATNMTKVSALFPQTQEITDLLNNATIYTQEANHELEHFINSFAIDPERLNELEQCMSLIHTLARKHRCAPEHLAAHVDALKQEYITLLNSGDTLETLQSKLAEVTENYKKLAAELTKKRKKAAEQLSKEVTAQLPPLALPHAKFTTHLHEKETYTAHGLESAEFIVQTNPGHPAQPLAKIASGGELSRISLAIQVVTAKTSPTPVLVFDEVDVGISGATASMVGQLLKQLSNHTQIFCVTHQPQVAVYADQHWLVQKNVKKDQTSTQIISLENQERIKEIARMLGGIKITEQTLAHAKELLEHAE